MRPTRQSLTKRFVIPKRNMVERNETKPWNKERESEMKRRIPCFCDRDSFLLRAPVLRHGMPIPSTLRLPRPRCGLAMTRKSGRFCLENGRFLFYAVIFFAVSLCIVFQTFRSGNCFVFPQNPPDLSLRGGRILHPTRQSLTMRFVIPKRNMVERNETKPWNEERGSRMKRRIHVFCDRDSFLLRAPVLRCGMPYLWLSDCHGRAAASQ